MARLQQLNPGNYRSSDRVSAEFENVVRYLNAAEHGNKTVGELLDILFDNNGEFDGPIELRLDSTKGLQYRIGEYVEAEKGWQTLASLSDIRGADGRDVGDVGTPVFFNRQDVTASGGETSLSYPHEDNVDIAVFVNGVLMAAANHTNDPDANTVDISGGFPSGLNNGDVATIYSVRKNEVVGYRRSDLTASAGQAVFSFPHTQDETLLVFRNGIAQRPGGSYDYTAQPGNDTITFMSQLSGGDVVTIMVVNSTALSTVAGLMTEDKYTDGDGFIPFAKLSIPDGSLPQAKIVGLTSLLQNRGRVYVSSATPANPNAGDFWVDTSASPNVLKFYDGTNWITTSPKSQVPSWDNSKAGLYLRVSPAGSSLEFASVDLSSLVPRSWVGTANGVAGLNTNGEVPLSQLPAIFSLLSLDKMISGAASNGQQRIKRIFKQKIRLDSIAVRTSSGSCDVQIVVDGATVGDKVSASSSPNETDLTNSIEVDASSTSKEIGFEISNNSTANDLEVTIAAAVLTV